MYTVTYKTKILKENNIKLLEHCFYTDTEYALYPIIYCKTIYVTHIPLYTYRIGREGQSVGLDSRIKHYEDHIKVSKRLLEYFNNNQNNLTLNMKKYIQIYISIILATSIGNFLIILPCNEDNIQKIKDFEKQIYDSNKELYYEMETNSKVVMLLRKSNYKLYNILSIYKRNKLK